MSDNFSELWKRLDKNKWPRHVAIIMDGNGRWASRRGFSRNVGHSKGAKVLKEILKVSIELKLEVLTVYAFSTENWNRPTEEVEFLLCLLAEYLEKEKSELNSRNVHLKFLGSLEKFSPNLQKLLRDSSDLMKNNRGLKFNVAINYGSQDEIIRATQRLAQQVKEGKLLPEEISKEIFECALDTNKLPPVDLLIRTGGDLRLSNFLLWQSAYAEFWFTKTLWSEFSAEEFIEAIIDFSKRERRFGIVEGDSANE